MLSCILVSVSKDLMEPEVARTAIEDLAIGLTERGASRVTIPGDQAQMERAQAGAA